MSANEKVAKSFSTSEVEPNVGCGSLSTRDQLNYMADIIEELHQMARRSRLQTLAGLLDLAHTEVRLHVARDEPGPQRPA